MRKVLSAFVLVTGLAVASVAANANPVTHTLTLADSAGNGSRLVETVPNDSHAAVSLSIGDDTFPLADSFDGATGILTGGSPQNMLYSGMLNSSQAKIAPASNGLTGNFYDQHSARYAAGLIEAFRATAAAVPEPARLLILGTAAVAGALLVAALAARADAA